MGPPSVERIITEISRAHPDMVDLFRRGQCYALWRIVRILEPSAICLYSRVEGHVYIGVGRRVYDIGGRCLNPPSDIAPLDHQNGDKPHRWGKRDQRRLVEIGATISAGQWQPLQRGEGE